MQQTAIIKNDYSDKNPTTMSEATEERCERCGVIDVFEATKKVHDFKTGKVRKVPVLICRECWHIQIL